MKTCASLLLFLLVALPCAGQSDKDHLFKIRDNSRKFGFIDRAGAVVIPPKYDSVGEAQEGRIPVWLAQKSGYVDFSGKVVIELKYDSGSDFVDSRAVVREGEKYSLIDPAGNLVAELPYRVLGQFHRGLLRLQASRLTDSSGKRLPTRYCFVDRQGKMVIEPQFGTAGEFPDDPADLPVGSLGREWCYFDPTGKILIRIPFSPQLDNPETFANGRLRVKEGFNWGYKDASGGWAIPPKYNDAEPFKGGFARVQDGDRWITIDVHGTLQPQRRFRMVGPYLEGLALASDAGLLGWIDAQGQLAFPLRKYDEAFGFAGGLARFKLDGLYGYLDRAGNMAIKNQYEDASDFDHGLAMVMTRAGWAYIDTKGAVVWKPSARQ